MTDETSNGLTAVLEAGRTIGAADALAQLGLEVPHTLVPDGCTLKSLEGALDAPPRKRGCPVFTHESGFTAYVKDHADEGSRIYADLAFQTMHAVLDHHHAAPGGERWGQHGAKFDPPKDQDWLTWTEHDNKPMGQMDFAQFVEDNLPAIVAPDGAELLELAQHLESTTKVQFKSAERLQGGSRAFHYEEQGVNKLGKGKVELPEAFRLRIPVFVKGDTVELEARLRYRISEGGLKLWYHLHRPQDALDAAFQRLVDGVDVATGIHPWFGTPAASA